ncbi:MAG: ATPase [Fluviicola sp. XM-24bin1]|nr:MAG: ATPase [Fluviicola sp. XM-24bin1]
MLIVVESGSTKSDWMLVQGNSRNQVSTIGFNPYFHNEDDVEEELRKNCALVEIASEVTDIFFYGAGCSIPELNAKIERGLKRIFTNAEVSVDHDLNACAYATYNGRPEIACILGTGSNSCYFDGEEMFEEIPALDYVLGNEGGGTYFGKQMLADFLYKRLPLELHDELVALKLDKASIVDNVYIKSNANVYIASFMPILIKHKSLPYCQQLIREGLEKFIEIHVKCFANYKDVEVNFVGSVAHLLSEELMEVCKEQEINVGAIVRRPLEKLVDFHLSSTNKQVV